MVRNPLLKYSIERLLNTANPRGEYFFKKTTLNKMIYLLYLRLKERGVDIKLPYFWYRYGSLVDERSFEYAVGIPLSRYYTRDGSTRAMGKVPHADIDDIIRSIIDEEILGLLKKYQNDNGKFVHDYLQLVLDDAYATAPYDFQRTFNRGLYKYVEQFKTPVRKKIPSKLKLEDAEVALIQDYLARLIQDFHEDFSEIYDLFLEWEDTMQLALKYNHTVALTLLKEYWEFFVNLLRIKKHENIPQSEVDEWISRYREHDFNNFERELNIKRNGLLLIHLEHSPLNPDIENSVNEIMDYAYELTMKNRCS